MPDSDIQSNGGLRVSNLEVPSTSLLRRKSIDAMLGTAERRRSTSNARMSMFSLMMIGVGATIGTGIFFVMSVTVPEAGPGVLLTFLLVGAIVSLTALCYAEVASKIPVSGSAYAYSFASIGELPAYLVGWALILEYGVAGAATSVGWGEYFNSFINDAFGWTIPHNLNAGLLADDPGIINLPAVVLVGMCCLLSAAWRQGVGARQRHHGDDQTGRAGDVHRDLLHRLRRRQPDALHAVTASQASVPRSPRSSSPTSESTRSPPQAKRSRIPSAAFRWRSSVPLAS